MARTKRSLRKTRRRTPTLASLKKKALALARGEVHKIKLDSFHVGYFYTRWASDESLDVDLLGVVPSRKVSSIPQWREYYREYTEPYISELSNETADELAADIEPEISYLCQQADLVAPSETEEEDREFQACFYHALDDETEMSRKQLLREYREKIRSEGGVWENERLRG